MGDHLSSANTPGRQKRASGPMPPPEDVSMDVIGTATLVDQDEILPANDDTSDIVVDWDGPNDPQNPKNWSFKEKWFATGIVASYAFISTISSSIVAPASDEVAAQFGVHNTVVTALFTSVFVIAYALGPLVLSPLSEMYGRARVTQLSNMWYFAWNLGCGFAQNKAQLLAFRFLAGLGGSAPLTVAGGVIGDVWRAEERGQAVALYSLAPVLGPVLGPITGAWVAQYSTWRWVFWSTSIVDACVQVLGLFLLRETFAPVILKRKADLIRKSMDLEKGARREVRTIYDGKREQNPRLFLLKSLIRPFELWTKEPIIQLLGIYQAYLYGLLYIFLTTMPSVFQGVYHQPVGISGLHYIALGIGLIGASQLNASTLDMIYTYLKNKNGGVGRPEFRLPAMLLGTAILPIGLLLTGWTVEKHVFWIVPDIGIVLVGMGVILSFQCIQTYIVDAFTFYAASVMAAVSCLRSLTGCGFPLFAPTMFSALGFGKGDTVLAAASIAIGVPACWIFWTYGERLRGASRFAR